jgi:4-phospho-D-threonate 3-dehydrogenase / 4-phospho-D-erythronate 3-dehydrogenase
MAEPHDQAGGQESDLPRPRVAVTVGDPAGIGPEVTLKAVFDDATLAACAPVVVGDAEYLIRSARAFNLTRGFAVVNAGEAFPANLDSSPVPVVYNLSNVPAALEMGREQAAAGRAAGEYIEAAVGLCLAGAVDAVTTAPINKHALHLGGYDFPGHTEMFAHLTGAADYAMAFIAPSLRVALLTTHLPLADAIKAVKRPALEKLIRLVNRDLVRFGLARPRIAVAALNPHGGESGLFGAEEEAEMLPAIVACREQDGVDVSGPFSGDTIFLRAARGAYDIVISCYHDQGLIPVKCFAFGEAVNVTLGLPFVRTSVDHGTAFDIAGRGVADHSSMVTAIKLAAELTRQARRERLP